MKVSESGEFGLIELIAKTVGKTGSDNLLIGIGDDAACWRAEGLQLATTDTLIEGVHFDFKTVTWRELGWKAMAVNVSDIAAMGGRPLYALVSLAIPADTDTESVVDLYTGMLELAKKFKVRIVGGDTVASPVTTITLTIVGEAENKGKVLRRSAAKPGDMIAVTGTFGASAAGLAMMQRRLSLDKKTEAMLREAHFKPAPRVKEGLILARNGVKAAIDVSDGLLGDLEKMCLASGVGAKLYSERIPIHPDVVKSFGNEAITLALTGGEDYELILTATQKILDKAKRELPRPLTVIGRIVKGKDVKVLDEDGNEFSWSSSGWDHFAKRKRA
ncbi:MAG: thiamine-phosphate kinase [Dehalococcoidia bacterium]|jgi:thiamine-monophosphate kinase